MNFNIGSRITDGNEIYEVTYVNEPMNYYTLRNISKPEFMADFLYDLKIVNKTFKIDPTPIFNDLLSEKDLTDE